MRYVNTTLPPWFDYLELAVNYSCMTFMAITLPLYIAVVCIMIMLRKTTYKGMFYRIFMVGAILDIIAILNNYIGAIFPARRIYIQFEDMNFRARYFIFALALDTFFVVSIIIINITMMLRLKRKYRLRKSASYCAPLNQKVFSEKQRQENNLTIVSVVTCAIEVAYYLYIIYAFMIRIHMNTRLFYLLYNVFNDIYASSSAWLILSCSPTLRQHLRNQLRLRRFCM
ncbi:hypothetical protein Aduo_017863 [Ancylostoma duodenale]